MARKKKANKNDVIKECYEIEVKDWEVSCRFGINIAPKDLIPGVYWEGSTLILTGEIISPLLNKANRTVIQITANPQLDDHWQSKPTIISAKAIGWMEIPRGDDRVIFNCSVPSQLLLFIAIAIQAGKIKYVSISGTKLRWRRGTISDINLSAHREE
ncbi:MAG TPA: hypothetical protein PK178_08745 [Smithellaceae bacterium]|nr:hypothetical protein [Smithellaceae bacterium]